MNKKEYTVALAGNPNCGKTTLFNALTGSREYVGNWPGVTVEKIIGRIKNDTKNINIVDLPGVYSLTATTPEETVTGNYLLSGDADLIIDVIDSTCLERSLGLALELLAGGYRVIFALNMADELEKQGISINTDEISRLLGAPAVEISAKQGRGISELLETVRKSVDSPFSNNAPKIAHDGIRYRAKQIADNVLIGVAKQNKKAELFDKILTDRRISLPIFVLCTVFIFYITFGSPGMALSNLFSWFCRKPLDFAAECLFDSVSVSPAVQSLVRDGIIGGIGGVLTFLPQIMLLFTMLALLEESGIMARAAYSFDPIFRKTGLSGKAFIPFAVGFGCSVPAVMSCRAQDSESDRIALAAFVPFVPCSARIPVFSFIFSAFFPHFAGVMTAAVYIFGVGAAIIFASILRRKKSGRKPEPFLMELPKLRLPSILSVFSSAWRRVRGFLIKAGTVILVCSVIVWILKNYSLSMQTAIRSEDSILARIGEWLSPLLKPIGLGNPAIVSSLLSGAVAKESAVSALEILSGGNAEAFILSVLNPASGLSFAAFVLLYCPCVATFNTLQKELGGFCRAVGVTAFYLAFAYAVAFVIYRLGLIFV